MSHLAIYLLALAALSPARPALALGGGLQDLASFPKYQVDFLNDLPISESEAAAVRHAGLTHEDQFLHLHPSQRHARDTATRDTIGASDSGGKSAEVGESGENSEDRPAPRGQADSSVSNAADAQRIALIPMLYTPATSPDIIPHSYLCAMPSENTTASQTAALEEAVDEPEADPEESWRALDHLNGQCLYLRIPQSWFTYSYCHNKDIRQFRELQVPHPHPEGFVPQEDEDYEAYTLGVAHPRKRRGKRNELQRTGSGSDEPEQTAAFGQSHASRYLVQRWSDGTRCDLTGKPREIEVQVYCSMTGTDAIYMVNEVAICQYVIVIHTPNLCSLPGFRPTTALEVDPARIRCREVVSDDEFDEWVTGADERQRLRLEQAERLEEGVVDARLASEEQDPELKIDGLKGVELTQEDINALLAAAFGGVGKDDELSHGEGAGEKKKKRQEKPSEQGLEELYVVGYSEDKDGNRVPVDVESVPPTKGESRRAFLERLQALIDKELKSEAKAGDKAASTAPPAGPEDTVSIQRDEL